MTKLEFMDHMKPLLKTMGYRKTRGYWHRTNGALISCIFLQGSQFDREDYYVEVGWAFPKGENRSPILADWYCAGRIGARNPAPEQLLEFLNGEAAEVQTAADLFGYLAKHRATRICGQHSFTPKL